MANSRLEKYLERLRQLESTRTTWESIWREIRDYMLPHYGQFTNAGQIPNQGERRMDKIFDPTGVYAMRTLAAGLQAGLSSPSRKWFKVELDDPDLLEWGPAKQWVQEVEDRMYTVLRASNFYQVAHLKYHELPGFGTACMVIDAHPDRVIICRHLPIGSYCIAESDDGIVDTLYRRIWMPAQQLARRFGRDRLSSNTRRLLDDSPWQYVEVIHVIEPRQWDRDPERVDAKNMPFRSLYFEADLPSGESDRVLAEGGYRENPIVCPRWVTVGGDMWGRGPGHEVLPDVKMLQEVVKTGLIQQHKAADPPVVGPAGYGEQINTLPGGFNPYEGDRPGTIHPLYQVQPDLRGLMELTRELRASIRHGLYNDLFMMLSEVEAGKNVTAEFVRDLRQERLLQLGPVVERLIYEDLQPSLERVFAIMSRAGKLPPPPAELEGREVRWQFISILAQAQKLSNTQAIQAAAAFAAQWAQLRPEVMDKVDLDQAVDEYSEALGAPAGIIRPDEEVEKIRRLRAQEEARQRQMEMAMAQAEQAEKAAGAVKAMASARIEPNTALDELRRSLEAM